MFFVQNRFKVKQAWQSQQKFSLQKNLKWQVKASESSKITLIKAQHVAVDASPEETYLRLMATTGTDHVTNYNQLTNPYFPK